MNQQSRRAAHRAPVSVNRPQLRAEPHRRRAPQAEPESEWTISQMSTGTPLLDQVASEQEQEQEEEGSTLDRVIHSTILLASCLDIPFTEYIPLFGILPASIGTVLDGLDKRATYDELGDPGVGQALTMIRTAVEFAHNPVENLSLAPTAAGVGLSALAFVDPTGIAAAAGAANDQVVAGFDVADLAFTVMEGHLETAQLMWDAFQCARLAAEGQSELSEAYHHLALDDGIDLLNSVMVAANRVIGLADITGLGGAFTVLRLVATNVAFSDDNTQALHESMVGPNYTVEPRTARGSDAWGETYDDQRSWVEDTRSLLPAPEEEEEQEQGPSPLAGLATFVRDAVGGAGASAKERWDALLMALNLGGAAAAMGPMDMAKLLSVAERPIEQLVQEGLSTAAQATEMLDGVLVEQRGRIEQINDGYAHLDGMLGELQGLMDGRHALKAALEDLGLPTAPLNVIDEQIGLLQEQIATQRAILDAAFGEAGILETTLQVAYDALTAQVAELAELMELLSTMPFDVAATVTWLHELAAAMAEEA